MLQSEPSFTEITVHLYTEQKIRLFFEIEIYVLINDRRQSGETRSGDTAKDGQVATGPSVLALCAEI